MVGQGWDVFLFLCFLCIKAQASSLENLTSGFPTRSDKNQPAEAVPQLNEPPSEKTGLQGFRPGPTQTGLNSHRR